ncbi:MAG: pilus assembly protein TadG-related protein, partial [Nitrospinota bacterium]
MKRGLRASGDDQRGTIFIITALGLVVMLGFAALAIDIAMVSASHKELQAIADSAALAGVVELIDGDTDAAVAEALASVNNEAKYRLLPYLQATASNVEVGTFDEDSQTFTSTTYNPNSLRITLSRRAASGTGVPTFFAKAFGIEQLDLNVQAVATTGRRDFVLVIDNSGSINDVTEYAQPVSGAPLPRRYAVNADLTMLANQLGVNKYRLRNFFCRRVFQRYWRGCPRWSSRWSYNSVSVRRTNALNIFDGGDGVGPGIEELADRLGPDLTPSGTDLSQASRLLRRPQTHPDVERLARLVAAERLLATGQCADRDCQEQPITVIEEAAKTFIDMLDDRVDRVAVVRFAGFNDPDNGGADPDADAEGHLISPLTSDFFTVKALIDEIYGNADVSRDGMTDIRSGIERAIEELEANSPSFALKVVILLTDGRANQPW